MGNNFLLEVIDFLSDPGVGGVICLLLFLALVAITTNIEINF